MCFSHITILALKLFLRNEVYTRVLGTDQQKEKLQLKRFKPRKSILRENEECVKIIKLPTFNNASSKQRIYEFEFFFLSLS